MKLQDENNTCFLCSSSCNDTCMKTCQDVIKFQIKKGWTQEELSREFDISLRTVANIHCRDPKEPLTEYMLMKIDKYKRSLK